jgi:hypothetical protein
LSGQEGAPALAEPFGGDFGGAAGLGLDENDNRENGWKVERLPTGAEKLLGGL